MVTIFERSDAESLVSSKMNLDLNLNSCEIDPKNKEIKIGKINLFFLLKYNTKTEPKLSSKRDNQHSRLRHCM